MAKVQRNRKYNARLAKLSGTFRVSFARLKGCFSRRSQGTVYPLSKFASYLLGLVFTWDGIRVIRALQIFIFPHRFSCQSPTDISGVRFARQLKSRGASPIVPQGYSELACRLCRSDKKHMADFSFQTNVHQTTSHTGSG